MAQLRGDLFEMRLVEAQHLEKVAEELWTELPLDFVARLDDLQDLDALVRSWIAFGNDLGDSCLARRSSSSCHARSFPSIPVVCRTL
jgi:hypothetical protein